MNDYLIKLKEIIREVNSLQGEARELKIKYLLGYLEALTVLNVDKSNITISGSIPPTIEPPTILC